MTCSMKGCERRVLARGLCGRHVQRLYKHGDPSVSLANREHDDTCAVEACGGRYFGNGYCRAHYDRSVAHGSPTLADEMAEAQGGVCAICARPPRGRGHESRLHLDHDHETGRIRAMLCGPCNKAIGLLDDNPELVYAAFSYLESHAEVAV